MSLVPLNTVIELDGHTYDDTFTLVDADATPTYEVIQQGNGTPIATGNMTRRSVGTYYYSLTSSVANGFSLWKEHQVKMLATVGGAVGKAVLARFIITPPVIYGAVSDGSASATLFITNLTETTSDHWKNWYCRLTSGSLAGQVRKITGYNGSTKQLSFDSGFTSGPANGTTFVITGN